MSYFPVFLSLNGWTLNLKNKTYFYFKISSEKSMQYFNKIKSWIYTWLKSVWLLLKSFTHKIPDISVKRYIKENLQYIYSHIFARFIDSLLKSFFLIFDIYICSWCFPALGHGSEVKGRGRVQCRSLHGAMVLGLSCDSLVPCAVGRTQA